MESYLTPETLEKLDEIQIEPLMRLDITNDPVPVYNDNYKIGNMVYSSTLAILKAAKDTLEPILKTTVDNSIQFIVLTMSEDKKSDYYLIRKASMKIGENDRILLPSIAMSMRDYKYLYSSPYNNKRYQQHVRDKSRNLLSFLSIPIIYNMSMRYYCPNWDLALRFEENLIQNGIDALPKEGFLYKVKGPNNLEMYLHGTVQISTDNSSHTLSKLTIENKAGDALSSTWYIDIPFTIRASIISRPYLVPSVQTQAITIKMNGKDYNKFNILP